MTGVRDSGVTFDNVNNLASVVNVMFMSRHDTTFKVVRQ